MGKRRKHASPAAAPNRQILAARLLLVIASVLSGYLAWGALSGETLAGCGPSSGCDKVLSSRWAYWLGIPVSVPALATYLGLLTGSFAIYGGRASMRRTAWLSIIMLSVMVTGVVFWFSGLQVFVLNSFCKFCFATHGAAFVAAALLLKNAPAVRVPSKDPSGIPFRTVLNASLAGVVGLTVLAAGQMMVEKAGYRVKEIASGAPEQSKEPQPRVLSLHNGTIRLDLNEIPVIGSPSAPHVIVSLFDYTCHHCRDMHGLLMQAKARFTNQLAIASLPMPLDGNCNHLVKRTPPAHANACEYARLGLAVWRTDREAFEKFDSWVFDSWKPSSPTAVPLDQVRQHAIELVGEEKLNLALADEWVNRQIQTNVAIYQANIREVGSGSMPQLILGQSVSVGALNRVDQLYKMIGERFGLN